MTATEQEDLISPAAEILGREEIGVDPDSGEVTLRYDAKADFGNRSGTISGGFLAAMLDSAASAPARRAVDSDEGVVTTDLRVSFERPARVGPLRATARITSRRDRDIHVETELTDPDDRVVARATATFRVVSK